MVTALDRANALIAKYREVSGAYYAEPAQTEVEDILADLMHFAAETGVDWIKAIDMAEIHYNEEQELDN